LKSCAFERSGALRLLSTIVLIDGQREGWLNFDTVVQAQIDAADVLVSKSVGDGGRTPGVPDMAQQLISTALGCLSERGVLPPQALVRHPLCSV
jgi:hypothetical protein